MVTALHSSHPETDEPPLCPPCGIIDVPLALTTADEPRLAEPDLQILGLLAEGYSIDAVAVRVHLSDRTVRRRLRALCDRFQARAPIQLAVLAARHGLI